MSENSPPHRNRRQQRAAGPARPRTRPALRPPDRPLVVAHRGASETVAEHTLDAYVTAIESGADGLECDVRLTRDGHLVCVHDRTVNRTSDGTGPVSELDLARLDALDFRSWHSDLPGAVDENGALPAARSPAAASDARGASNENGALPAARSPAAAGDSPYLAGVAPDRVPGGGVLTLERLLELVRDAPRPVQLLIETKHPTRYGGLVEKELVELLDRFGWAGRPGPPTSLRAEADMTARVTVMSFAPTALRRIRLLAPDVPTVLLLEWRLPRLRDGILPAGVPVAGPGLSLLRADPGFVARAHGRGNRVYVWTVNQAADVDFVRRLGVDTIITDRPREVIAQLGDRSVGG